MPTEHFPVSDGELEVGESADSAGISALADEQWWQEVEREIEADSGGSSVFDRSPTIVDLLQPLQQPLAACACGRLPHLCTCEYYRLKRISSVAEHLVYVSSSEDDCSVLPARLRIRAKRQPEVGEDEPRHQQKRRRPG